jgi:hypothetical protein
MSKDSDVLSNTAAYAPFKTFLNALESFRGTVPGQINRSVWPSFSGGTVSQLITTFRFLGLIDEDFKPTRQLAILAGDNVPARQSELRQLLQRSYPEIIAIDLTTATPKQLNEAFSEAYTVTGATLQKAIAFFLHAAQYAELPLSQYLTRRRGRRKRPPLLRGRNGNGTERLVELPVEAQPQQGTARTLQLASGGEIALRIQFDAFTVSQSDREFIFSLIDQLAAYERGEGEAEYPAESPVRSAPRQSRVIDEDEVPF